MIVINTNSYIKNYKEYNISYIVIIYSDNFENYNSLVK